MCILWRAAAAGVLVVSVGGAFGAESAWVHAGGDGKLVYQATEKGDRVMDFSYAGYMGGGVALPEVGVVETVRPSGGDDDTGLIQGAIDRVGKRAAGEGGFRGAVLLGPGVFTCAGTLNLNVSGVVLRGSGSGAGGTTIRMVGAKHEAIVIGAGRGRGAEPVAEEAPRNEKGVAITDAYVAEGTRVFSVADAGGLRVGETVAIRRPTTPAWVHLMGMDTMVRDGKKETWIGDGRSEVMERRITAIEGNRVTVDVPLADSLDAAYLNPPGATVAVVKGDRDEAGGARVTQVGVERLHIQCAPLEIDFVHAPYSGIRVGGDDCWVLDVNCEETMNTTTLAGKRITMEGVVVTHTYGNLGASKPSDFSIEGSEILIDRCSVTGDNEYFVWTSSLEAGPNVVLNSVFRGRGSRIQPHQRWSTALLVDNCVVPDGGIDFANRGVAGSGHGWTMGWAVAWNCVAKTYIIQQPPGAMNWAIGCVGERQQTARYFDTGPVLAEGTFESHGERVGLASLYLAQLQERVGEKGLQSLGYAGNTVAALGKKQVEMLPPWQGKADAELGADVAVHRPLAASSMAGSGREHSGEKAVDGDAKTYWETAAGDKRMTLEMDMEGPVAVDAVAIEEAVGATGAGQVTGYTVEGQVDSDWKVLAEGTAIGERKVDRFPKVTVWKVRVTLKGEGAVAIRTVSLYGQGGRGG